MTYSILIVDDERLSRDYVRDLVTEIQPDATVFEAESADEAIPILENESIDILFSDIEMPGTNGLDLLKSVTNRDFELIYVTAYSQYAIQAIKEGASDYVLKPIKKTEFRSTFEKALERRSRILETNSINGSRPEYLSNRLIISHQQGIKFITLRDIVYLEASNTYTTIVLQSGEKIITSKPINRFERKLSSHWFFRIHKSHIINIYHFKEYLSKDGDVAVMDNGDKLFISRYRLVAFLKLAEDISGRLKI